MNEECEAPNLIEHRENMAQYDDDAVISELHRAWGCFLPGSPELKDHSNHDWVVQDWSSFRAITTREARRRGLGGSIPKDLRLHMAKWGVVV